MKRSGTTHCGSKFLAVALAGWTVATWGQPIASANAPAWGPVGLLNSNGLLDTSNNAGPMVATSGSGTWITLWYAQDAIRVGRTDIILSRSTDGGGTWSPPAALNVMARMGNGNNSGPAIAAGAQNVWIAVWASNDTLGGTLGASFHILISRSTNNGMNWSTPQALAPNAASQTGVHLNPRIATDRNNDWVVVWTTNEVAVGGSTTRFNPAYSRSTDNGLTWTAPVALDTSAMSNTASSFAPDISTNRQGTWIATWDTNDPRYGASASERDIVYSVSTNNGTSWAPTRALNTDAPTDTAADFDARIASDGAHRWVAVWYANNIGGQWGTDYDACVSVSTDDGATWSPRAPLNSDAYTDAASIADQRPTIAFDSGNWVAVWDKVTGDYRDIMTATSTTGGLSWTRLAAVSSNAGSGNGNNTNAFGAVDGTGHWVTVWRSLDTLNGTIPRAHYNIFRSAGHYRCGDGALDPGEQCDNGPMNGMPGSCCDAMCRAAPMSTTCQGSAAGACSTNQCNAVGQCVAVGVANCCRSDTMCVGAGACFTPRCNLLTSLCENRPIEGCCTDDRQCSDPNVCNMTACDQTTHTCRSAPIANCCMNADQCDDSNLCTEDTCTGNRCVNTPIANCPAPPDAGTPDMGIGGRDTGSTADGGTTMMPDASGPRDNTGNTPQTSNGCSCGAVERQQTPGSGASAAVLGFLAAAWVAGRRRRSHRT